MTADDPFAALAPAVAYPFGDAGPRDFLRALIAGETAAALSGFAANLERSGRASAALAAGIAAYAARLSHFEEAWHPSFGGLYHVLRNRSPGFIDAVAIEIAGACAEGSLGGAWPRLAAFDCRTEEDAARARTQVSPAMHRDLGRGLDLVRTGAPVFMGWIEEVVAQVAPLALNGREVASWSSLHYPGLVSMTIFDSPLDMAETLVHEASHQWWHMLDRIAPLVEPEARWRTCWSPVKQCERPIPNVLLALHAFGNVALFFEQLRRAGLIGPAEWTLHTQDLMRWLPDMAAGLLRTDGLTEDGMGLLSAIEEALDAHFLKCDAA